jgi:hypothetical protein
LRLVSHTEYKSTFRPDLAFKILTERWPLLVYDAEQRGAPFSPSGIIRSFLTIPSLVVELVKSN